MIIRSAVNGYLKTIMIIPDLDCATIAVIRRQERCHSEITLFNVSTNNCTLEITVKDNGADLHIIAENDELVIDDRTPF